MTADSYIHITTISSMNCRHVRSLYFHCQFGIVFVLLKNRRDEWFNLFSAELIPRHTHIFIDCLFFGGNHYHSSARCREHRAYLFDTINQLNQFFFFWKQSTTQSTRGGSKILDILICNADDVFSLERMTVWVWVCVSAKASVKRSCMDWVWFCVTDLDQLNWLWPKRLLFSNVTLFP